MLPADHSGLLIDSKGRDSMYQTRWMRVLRLKHHISLVDLSKAAKVSPQRISQIELSSEPATNYHRELIAEAFAIVADKRGKEGAVLRSELKRLEYRLLDFTEEDALK